MWRCARVALCDARGRDGRGAGGGARGDEHEDSGRRRRGPCVAARGSRGVRVGPRGHKQARVPRSACIYLRPVWCGSCHCQLLPATFVFFRVCCVRGFRLRSCGSFMPMARFNGLAVPASCMRRRAFRAGSNTISPAGEARATGLGGRVPSGSHGLRRRAMEVVRVRGSRNNDTAIHKAVITHIRIPRRYTTARPACGRAGRARRVPGVPRAARAADTESETDPTPTAHTCI